MKSIAENKRARFDYDIKETFTAGMVLTGPEVKSVKSGNVSLAGSYVTVSSRGVSLINCHIGPYTYAPSEGYEPTRSRGLLLNQKEINRLLGKEKGWVLVPTEIFQDARGRIKLHIGLGPARKKTDKRDYIKTRDAKKEIRKFV